VRELFGHIDGLLRGRYTRRDDLLEGRIGLASRRMAAAGLVLGAVYGAFMGIFAVLRADHPSWLQLAATMAKVPLLFLLTLVVTFPSLYVFSALANSRLSAQDTLRLLLAAVTVNLALLASFGPVTGFFTLSTDSYPFLVVLNTIFFAISGFAGLAFLRRALATLFEPAPPAKPAAAPPTDEPSAPENPARLQQLPGMAERPAPSPHAPAVRRPPTEHPGRRVFTIWTITYAVVGAQMAWILRPFIGSPGMQFAFFRPRGSNFFEGLWHSLQRLFH
jgi:hypothetical protein